MNSHKLEEPGCPKSADHYHHSDKNAYRIEVYKKTNFLHIEVRYYFRKKYDYTCCKRNGRSIEFTRYYENVSQNKNN